MQSLDKLSSAQTKRKKELTESWHRLGHLSELITYRDKTSALRKHVNVDTWAGTLTWRKLVGHPLLSIVETIALESVRAAETVACCSRG